MTRRNTELILLCLAAPLVLLLFAMVVVNEGSSLSLQTLGVPLGIFGAFVVAHLAVRHFAPNADPAILPIVFALSGTGIAFITRIAPYSDTPAMASNQIIWLFLGVVCMIVVLAFMKNIDKVADYKYTLMIGGFALLLSPLLPGLGQEVYGSHIWLSIAGYSFQPGEIAKIVIVLFLAGYLAQNREMLSVFTWRVGPLRLPDIRTLLPLLLMWGVSLLIVVVEKDLGSALLCFFIFLIMLYVATGKKSYLIIGGVLIVIGAVAAASLFSHVQERVSIWLDPFADPSGSGYQLVQSIYALADGGLFGVGVGNGMAGGIAGFSRLPVVESGFIFTTISEETGLLGGAGVLLLYLCFAIRGVLTAARAKSDVSSLVGIGLTSIIVLQAFIIVGGITRVIPLTGITLPFVSQGGSSLLAGFIIVGFLLRCGDEGTGVETEVKQGTAVLDPNSVLGRVSLGRRLTGCMIIFAVLFAVLVASLTYIMVIKADYYQNLSGNNHTLAREAQSERGTISTYDGVVLAQSVENESGTYDRVYPAGDLASHVVGYYSQVYGTSGIESSYNATLKGQRDYATITDLINAAAGVSTTGNDVKLTINSTIQQAAQDALGDNAGACVVMDPSTGAILAMASSPTYDAADIETVLAEAASDSSSSSSVLINRATQALYAPGSTFKIVTLATALTEGICDEDTTYEAPASMDIGGADVTNYGDTNYGTITVQRATEVSSNVVFGQIGVQLGAATLVAAAEDYGFNSKLSFDLPLVASIMADPDEMSDWETAWAADGQPVTGGDASQESDPGPQVTALQMAMVAAAVANDGTIMTPYIVDSVYNANGEKSYSTSSKVYSQPMSADIAERVYNVMLSVVNNGTGSAAAIDGADVGGKTGTAETGNELDDSWFIGFASVDGTDVVIAIVLEESSERNAALKAQNVLTTALKVQGLL